MNAVPRLTVGLPVYNGEKYLAESLDALLGQSYGDFELIISDNASTDATEAICREYAAKDPRITYLRQPANIGATPNHNFVFEQSHTELFKWASYDDLYGRDGTTRRRVGDRPAYRRGTLRRCHRRGEKRRGDESYDRAPTEQVSSHRPAS